VSAAVVPFTGKQVRPTFERSPYRQREDIRAVRDARLIREARQEEDGWLATAFLALLKVMDAHNKRHILTLESMLTVRALVGGNETAEKAAAIVRLVSGSAEHRQRVSDTLNKMNGGAA
jgi:hypothetical protein